jgi:hypothetical protein
LSHVINTTENLQDMSKKILVLPDVQAKDGVDFTYLERIGQYMCDKRPDAVVCIGDFADMPSLSSYDVGKKSFEGRRYTKDVDATHRASEALFGPLRKLRLQQMKNKQKVYTPFTVMTLGNHENRINRAVNDDPKLEGLISIDDLNYREYWDNVYPFLEVVTLSGVAFSHYFVTGTAGRPASTASAQLNKKHMSCVAGHQQGLQIATAHRADGIRLTSIIAGSCYEHDEDYMGVQGNKHWRGFLMLHDVKDGEFDLMPVSLDYLEKKYK